MPKNIPSLSIPKQIIHTLPVSKFDGDIFVVDTPSKADAAVDYLMQFNEIGFDTETKPCFKKGMPNKVALMQLSTDSRCYLFRLNLIGIGDGLKGLIESPNIVKIGISVHDDFNVMHRSGEFAPAGFVELQRLVKEFNIADISLQKVYAILFSQKISKSQRLTNWEAPVLSHGQQLYAATDAWACLRIYRYLMSGQFDPTSSPYINSTDEN